MAWLTSKRNRYELFPVGPYRMEMPVSELANFAGIRPVQLAPDEIAFDGETAYEAPAIELFDLQWEVGLNAVNGKVYKIALYRSTRIRAIAVADFADISVACSKLCGRSREAKQDMRLWAVDDGYVVLKSNAGKDGESEYYVDLYLTSREARDFPRAGNGIHVASGITVAPVTAEEPQSNAVAISSDPPREDASEHSDGELARLHAVLGEIEAEIGERPVYIDADGRTFLHPRLAAELRKTGNGWLKDELREFLKQSQSLA